MKMHGKFKRIYQDPQKIISQSFSALNPEKHRLYQICLTELKFFTDNTVNLD